MAVLPVRGEVLWKNLKLDLNYNFALYLIFGRLVGNEFYPETFTADGQTWIRATQWTDTVDVPKGSTQTTRFITYLPSGTYDVMVIIRKYTEDTDIVWTDLGYMSCEDPSKCWRCMGMKPEVLEKICTGYDGMRIFTGVRVG